MSVIQQLLTDHIDIWTAAETEKKSGRGRVSSNAANVYGVKKLRELILELAVRGKLVPQDASEEPASELLKRIQIEKDKLAADGKIKNDKAMPPISDEDKPFELPQSWKWIRLNDLLRKIGAGSTPLGGKQVYIDQGIPFLRSQNVWDQGLRLNDVAFIAPETHLKMAGTHVCAGDLLFNITGASIGRCALVPDCFETGNVSQHVTIIRSVSKDILRFLHLVLISRHVQKTVMDVQVGVSREGLSIGKLAQFVIPIAPLDEQIRIIERVDELMALCDQLETQHGDAADAHEQLVSHLLGTLTQSQNAAGFKSNWQRIAAHFDTLFTTEASIDALKHTLLQLAVMGKLVAQDANDEPASELLKHIQAEKAKLIADGKIKKDRLFVPSVERENPYSVPRSWEWITIDEISQVGTGATPLRTTFEYYNPPSVSWVTSGETSNAFIFETEQYVSALALMETNLTVYPRGTLIVAMYGQGKTRGQITELMIEACTNQACAAIQLYSGTEYHRKYVKLFFEKIYDEIRELAAGGAQPNLNLSKIKETLLPLPPLSEQHRIVVKIDELINICNRLRLSITYANQQQQKLADVLVEHAVMG